MIRIADLAEGASEKNQCGEAGKSATTQRLGRPLTKAAASRGCAAACTSSLIHRALAAIPSMSRLGFASSRTLHPVRIATWNLERADSARIRQAQETVLRELTADILVLTEPGPSYRPGPRVVTSPPERSRPKKGDAWVAIVGDSVEPVGVEIPYERLAVAARARIDGRSVVVYGSVLPWAFAANNAPELVRARESAFDTFLRVLREQVADIAELRRRWPADLVVWAGDFNQTLSGPSHGGSAVKREALRRALDELGLVAFNADAPNARPGMHTIDLICGPRETVIVRQARVDPVRDGLRLSDHAAYWVEMRSTASEAARGT